MTWPRRHHLHEAERDVDRALKHLEETVERARASLRLHHGVELVDPEALRLMVDEVEIACAAWATHGRDAA